MTIYKSNVQTLLDAHTAKNASKIVAQSIFIPNLGVPTSTATVQAWIDEAKTVLQNIMGMTTDTEVNNAIKPLYNKCCVSCKAIVDAASIQESCATDYKRVRSIRLYKFALVPS